MPNKPPARCRKCKQLHAGTGLCPTCQAAKHRKYDGGYRKQRAELLAERPLCEIRYPGICTVWATQADHIGGSSALRPACRPCNLEDGRRRART